MTSVDRWQLPDGVEEVLPAQAEVVEHLRRRLLDLYRSWGYQLVIPPLMEFTESLLVGLGEDLDLLTFKLTDQLSGRTLGIRADITPQVARIDAHSFPQEGVTRLCYAGSVLHTRPKTLTASRSPIQLGAELYGDNSLAADVEVIRLMLATLESAGLTRVSLDLGHVGIGKNVLGAWDFHTPGRKEHACFRGDRLVIDENDRPTTLLAKNQERECLINFWQFSVQMLVSQESIYCLDGVFRGRCRGPRPSQSSQPKFSTHEQ